MFCTNCGKQLSTEMSFCSSCGTPLQLSRNDNYQNNSFHIQKTAIRQNELEQLQMLITYFSKKSKQYNDYDSVCAELQQLSGGRRHSLLVWGIILFVFGIMVILSDFKSFDSISEQLAMALIMLVLPGIGMISGYIFSSINYNKKVSYYSHMYNTLSDELFSYYAEYPLCPIGPEYSNPDVLYALLQVIQSGRADTIKEALNILIDDSYRQKMQEYSQKIEKSVADIERNTKVSAIFCAGRFFR